MNKDYFLLALLKKKKRIRQLGKLILSVCKVNLVFKTGPRSQPCPRRGFNSFWPKTD